MHICVIIGTYNNQAHVADTIGSIRQQDSHDWTCLVIDNGSTDGTAVAVKALIAADGRFSFFPKANEGPSAGRNFARKLVPPDARYVHFLDGDDRLDPSFLRRMAGYLDEHPKVGLVACQFEVINEHGASLGPGFRSRFGQGRAGFPRKLRDDEADTPFESFFAATGQGPFAMFRKDVLERTTGYEEGFWSHEDSDIFCQMALLAEVHYLRDRLYLKRVHSNNLTASPKADYSKFRRKWDFYSSREPGVNERIESALRYYYGSHAPLRHFKVSVQAFRDFLQNRKKSALGWSWYCFRNGIADLVFRRELSRKLDERARRLAQPASTA